MVMDPQLGKAYSRRRMVLGFLCLSLLIVSLNNIIVNIALPLIAEDLHATYSYLQWVVDAYILTLGAFLLTMGSIGDSYGRKRILMIGLILFGLASMLAGISTSISQLVLMRGFMGLAAAMIMPSTLSILTAAYENTIERSQAIAIWAAIYSLGIGISPMIAGFLLMRFSWNSVFFINIPIVVVAIIGEICFIPESRDEKAAQADVPSVILSIIGLVFLFFGIIQAGNIGARNPAALISLTSAAIFIAAFLLWENRTKTPMLPLYFFENPSFAGANIALAFIMFSMFGTSFCMNQYLQVVLGYSVLQAGLALMPMALTAMVSSIMSANVADKMGIKLTVSGSILIAAIGMLILVFVANITTPYAILLSGMVLIGLGLGTATGPATDSIMGAIPLDKAGLGSAMNDTTRELGGALGVALLGTILNSGFQSNLNELRMMNLLPPHVHDTIIGGLVGAHDFASYIQFQRVQEQFLGYVDRAFVVGLKDSLFLAAILMILAALLIYAILPARIRRYEE
jgi:EmrB/QacA subfamily drug resistance transporter